MDITLVPISHTGVMQGSLFPWETTRDMYHVWNVMKESHVGNVYECHFCTNIYHAQELCKISYFLNNIVLPESYTFII
jgi:hypothetical protein